MLSRWECLRWHWLPNSAQPGDRHGSQHETHDANGRTRTTLTVNVTGADGQPAQGIVVFA